MTDAYHCHHGCMRNRCNDCRGRETWEVFAADGPPADPHDPSTGAWVELEPADSARLGRARDRDSTAAEVTDPVTKLPGFAVLQKKVLLVQGTGTAVKRSGDERPLRCARTARPRP